MQKYKNFENEKFTYIIIHFFISLAYFEFDNVEKIQKIFKRAEIIWFKKTRDF